jgi:hypothetical protein
MEKINLIKAEQQILGFYHSYNGGDLTQLCEAMSLEKEEWEEMVREGMVRYLPQELFEEIKDWVNKK